MTSCTSVETVVQCVLSAEAIEVVTYEKKAKEEVAHVEETPRVELERAQISSDEIREVVEESLTLQADVDEGMPGSDGF